MKKYIQLSLQKEFDYPYYHPMIDELSAAFHYFLLDASPKYLIETINNVNSHGIGYDFSEVAWSRKNNAVAIETSGELEEDGIDHDLFIMKFDNFKQVVEDWIKLESKSAPEIYFIQESNGEIVVRESLEQ